MPFQQIAGHRRLIALLSRATARGTLPPSLIFAGPSGVGKRLAAIALAQAVNCLNPTIDAAGGIDACGTCAACTRIARGVHPDVIVVTPGDSGTIKIDQVRDVVDRAAYRPFEGRRRMVIVDEADAMQAPAQNALLKTLEEPPAASSFVLVTARPDVLLPTVRSRCPILRFRPLDASEIVSALTARGVKTADARAVAATADGSMRRALEASAGELAEARSVAERTLSHVAQSADPRARLEAAKELLPRPAGGAAEREQLATHLRAMAALLRDIELVALGANREALANPDSEQTLGRLAGAFGGERGPRAFCAVDQALVALERNASAKTVADWLLLEL